MIDGFVGVWNFQFRIFFFGRKIWRVYFWAAWFKYSFLMGIWNNRRFVIAYLGRVVLRKNTSKLVKARKFGIRYFGGVLFAPGTFLGFDFCPHSIIPVTTITILLDICLSFARLWLLLYRRGLRINTDRFPKRAPKAQASRGVREQAPTGKKIGFLLLKVPFPGFPSHSDRMLARW